MPTPQCSAYVHGDQCVNAAKWVADLSDHPDGGPEAQYACDNLDHYRALCEHFGAQRVEPVRSAR